MADKERNLFQRMLAAQSSIGMVAKNLSVGYGKSSYKAVSDVDVLAAVKQAEAEHGIYSYPVSREIIDQQILETVDREGNKKKQMYVRIRTRYRFVNVDNPEEYIETEAYGDGLDSADKAPGKSATYSDKYCLMRVYKLSTGEDPDQYESPEIIAAKKQAAQAEAEEKAAKEREARKDLVPQAERAMVENGLAFKDVAQLFGTDKVLSEWPLGWINYIVKRPQDVMRRIDERKQAG